MRYEYWVIRYVPDSIRGEYVNVGVIAGRDQDWAMRRVGNLRRASRLGGSATSTEAFLRRIEETIEARLHVVESLLPNHSRSITKGDIEDLRVRMNNLVQLSPSRPVLAESSKEASELAFDLMVVDSDRDVRQRSRTRVVNGLRKAFNGNPELAAHVERSQRATVGAQETSIDFALKLRIVRQMSQVWAFDVKDTRHLQTQIQAWNYLLGLLRESGGELRVRSGVPGSQIPRSVDINAVYTAPSTRDGETQLDIAADGWKRLGVQLVPASRSQSVVEQAERILMG